MKFPKKYPAIKVSQPFGDFYILSIPAVEVLEFTFSDALRYNEEGELLGSQRKLDEKKRVKEITDYINGSDTAFPNSIILAANYNQNGLIEDNEELRWKITEQQINTGEKDKESVLYFIEVPTNAKLAAIVDGQHRINGFKNATIERQNDLELLIAVYFDLPNPYQAYLFANINYNQKPVDKSLALEQFGYMIQLQPSKTWSPELLAVSLSKRLNVESNSPFFNHIKVAPQNDEYLLSVDKRDIDWVVSTATVVDGILKLITSNPKRDSDELRRMREKERDRNNIQRSDNSPMRDYYLNNNDLLIYTAVFNFFKAVDELIFRPLEGDNSYIKKTIGIQALFGVLKEILSRYLEANRNLSVLYFSEFVKKIQGINFNDNFFTASGIGKSRIQNIILIALGFKSMDELREDQLEDYSRLLGLEMGSN